MRKKGYAQAWIAENASHDGQACLPWPFDRDRGRASASGGYSVCRKICEAAHGPPPTPQHQAAHSCGKAHEGCVNPRHLRWATPRENSADRHIHGTQTKKLTVEQVREILNSSEKNASLARRFGVDPSNISHIRRGKQWTIAHQTASEA